MGVPDGSALVLYEFTVKPEMAEQAEAMMGELLPGTRSYDGCLDLTLYRDAADPLSYTIVMHWTTHERFRQYREWRAADASGTFDAWPSFLSSGPTIRLLEASGM